GGTLTMATRNVTLDDDGAAERGLPRGGAWVALAVSDTGHGMGADTLAHIFEPFFTTKQEGKGTGLGLATVFGTIKQSDGHVAVDSQPERGATFTIYLPPAVEAARPVSVSPPPAARARAGRDGSPSSGGSEIVLVVEDDALVRDV